MKLNNENYFSKEANNEFFSVSQFKSFLNCEASALAELNGDYQRPSTTALLVGSYADAHFSNEAVRFMEEHPEIFKKDGSLKADYIRADQMIERVAEDDLFMKYMSGQTQKIMTGELFGYYWKIKVDVLHDDKIVDLKCVKDFEPVYKPGEGKLPWWQYWGYDIQGAVYQEIVKQNVGKRLPFFIAGITKEQVTDFGLFQIPQEQLNTALKIVEYNIDRFAEIKEGTAKPTRCGKCSYCKETKVLTEPILLKEEI